MDFMKLYPDGGGLGLEVQGQAKFKLEWVGEHVRIERASLASAEETNERLSKLVEKLTRLLNDLAQAAVEGVGEGIVYALADVARQGTPGFTLDQRMFGGILAECVHSLVTI